MLTLIDRICGRPWAIRGDIAAMVRGMLDKEGLAGLRHLAELRAAVHAFDEGSREERLTARRGDRGAQASGNVALIPIVGTLTQRGDVINSAETRSTASVAEDVAAAAAEPKVDGIVLEVDSPGGEVYGVPEAWAAIHSAAKLKPVVAHANSQAASAALYLASAATEVGITPSGEMGSVGVYGLHVDISKMLEESGEKWEFIVADESPFKVEGNPAEPLTEDARAEMKKSVNRYMGMFVRDLSRGRGVSVEHVRQNFGRGRMLSPQEAVSVKMADWVGTLDQAIHRAAVLGVERREAARMRVEQMAAVDREAEARMRGL